MCILRSLLLTVTLALTAAACASGPSAPSLPIWSPGEEVPLPAPDLTQIQVAAIRHFQPGAQQVLCVGVATAKELTRNPPSVDAPEILLSLLGSRNQFRPYSACEISRSDVVGGRPEVLTAFERTPATAIVLGAPFGVAEDRAVINLTEASQRRSGRHRCEAQRGEGGAWNIVRCARESG